MSQLMPKTRKHLGMKIDSYRLDIIFPLNTFQNMPLKNVNNSNGQNLKEF